MAKFKFISPKNINKLPEESGVYVFKKGVKFLYIGKASNIKERVKNHFQRPVYKDGLFLEKIKKIGYLKTVSEIEALILEANLIKKYQPKYNVLWRDDKNYFYVGITKENLPRIFITHQITKLKAQNFHPPKFFEKIWEGKKFKTTTKSLKLSQNVNYLGPFVDGKALKQTLRTLRKVFPYYTVKKHSKLPCPYCYLGLCPGPEPDLKEEQKNIKNLITVLQGKRKQVLKVLKKEMKRAAKEQIFEKAAKIRDQIIALEKVINQAKVFSISIPQGIEVEEGKATENIKALKRLKKLLNLKKIPERIEAYDVSNLQGQEATGSMITFVKGNPEKNFYRRFKIKIAGKSNDVAMLGETLKRRLRHYEWSLPNLILIDGGIAQLNAALKIKNQKSKIKNKIEVVSIAKKKNELYLEGRKEPILLKNLPREISNLVLQLRDEAHRFAISYHRKLKKKKLFP